jgi:hypothetical protein
LAVRQVTSSKGSPAKRGVPSGTACTSPEKWKRSIQSSSCREKRPSDSSQASSSGEKHNVSKYVSASSSPHASAPVFCR